MIESHTKLPAQEEGTEPILDQGRQAVTSLVEKIGAQAQALSGGQVAESAQSVGELLSELGRQIPFRSVFDRFRAWVRLGGGEGSLLSRFALHFVVIFLAVGVLAISQVTLPEVDLSIPTPTPAPELGSHTVQEQTSNRGTNRFANNTAALFQAPVPHTEQAERDRMQIITYTVQSNDNVWAIAQGFGLQAETVLWANDNVAKSPDLLRVGQTLIIPPVDGIYYTIAPGDTVEKLAKTYKASAEKIIALEFNQLVEPYTLVPGQKLMIPGGRKQTPVTNYYPMTRVGSAPAGAPKGTGTFAWPTHGYLSQRYWSGHPAIDIAGPTGTPILAADAGYVVMSGRDTWGYGNQVVIDHGNGFWTRYAHLNTIQVKAGQTVKKNQQIGTMGSTGRSTGPHLHFEVIQAGTLRNPLGYLP